MPHLDSTGPEGKGSRTGRGLGRCKPAKNSGEYSFGRGMGLRRRAQESGKGKGLRLRSGGQFDE
ncbi:MAG: DUF5320 domain-containing protein [Bacteroidales bacterium]|nr:DUF5320 domain-containing protein [Bacteroidales bacterium]